MVADRYPADGQRPGRWRSGGVGGGDGDQPPDGATIAASVTSSPAATSWFGMHGALAAAATGVAVDPVIARKEAAAMDTRETLGLEHTGGAGGGAAVRGGRGDREARSAGCRPRHGAAQRTAYLEQRLADLERRLAESQRRNGLADSFRRLLMGDPAWAG